MNKPDTPKIIEEPIQFIRKEKPTRDKWVYGYTLFLLRDIIRFIVNVLVDRLFEKTVTDFLQNKNFNSMYMFKESCPFVIISIDTVFTL